MEQIALMYHDVYIQNLNESGFQTAGAMYYKVSLKEFVKQVALISDYCQEKGHGKDYVCFTFDDGGGSFLNPIADVLEEYGFRGVFFITTSYVGTGGFLSQDDILQLRKRGHFVGAHSHTHPSRMNQLQKRDIDKEWNLSTSLLSEYINEPIGIASIPGGSSSEKVIQSMIENGIRTIYDSTPTIKKRAYKGMQIVGRYAITNGMSPENVLNIIKCPYKRFCISLRYQALEMTKTVSGNLYPRIRNFLLKKKYKEPST
ncbi:hypothetical protein IX332_000744 [Porphyromonas levii]|uniref:polysaccharide deacetylase family protein n=1 Tax=Porphyromonas levii TaxID=28114 RepID=UPI001B8BFC9C|nr:polysaccharide deacetylase family protein [Porphyromonas levii]MBR8729424.1 hypothetical protein [Porphyromonas levii]